MFRLGLYATPPKVNRVPKIPRLAGEQHPNRDFWRRANSKSSSPHCPEIWFRAIVDVGRTYGWRIGELLRLRVRQVDLLANVIRLEPRHHEEPGRKGSEHDANVHALLSECVSGKQPDDNVFTWPDGNPVGISGRLGAMPVLLLEFRSCYFTISAEQQPGISEGLELPRGDHENWWLENSERI